MLCAVDGQDVLSVMTATHVVRVGGCVTEFVHVVCTYALISSSCLWVVNCVVGTVTKLEGMWNTRCASVVSTPAATTNK